MLYESWKCKIESQRFNIFNIVVENLVKSFAVFNTLIKLKKHKCFPELTIIKIKFKYLITDETEDEFCFFYIGVRRFFGSRRPKSHIGLTLVVAWVPIRIEVSGNGHVTRLCAPELSKCVEGARDVAVVVVLVERSFENCRQSRRRGRVLAGVTH